MTENSFQLRTGMDVVDGQDAFVGSLDRILAEDDTGETRFITVNERLVPVQALEGVEKGRVKLAVSRGKLNEFPEHPGEDMPSRKAQQKAYSTMGLGPSGEKKE